MTIYKGGDLKSKYKGTLKLKLNFHKLPKKSMFSAIVLEKVYSFVRVAFLSLFREVLVGIKIPMYCNTVVASEKFPK